MNITQKDDIGLVWLFKDQDILNKFLAHNPPFCDAPEDFYDHRGWPGELNSIPLFPCCPVAFLVGKSRATRVISVIARIGSEIHPPHFKMVTQFGSHFQGISLPRCVIGQGGRIFCFPDGIWLRDVRYQDPPKPWPHIPSLPMPTGSVLLRPSNWSRLVSAAGLVFPPCSAAS